MIIGFRKLPYKEKHVLQQASILGNLENFGVLKETCLISGEISEEKDCKKEFERERDSDVPAVVEFGAGRGYLTQVLADCYGIKKVLLVERKSYKLKADRSLRQKESLVLERLRIDSMFSKSSSKCLVVVIELYTAATAWNYIHNIVTLPSKSHGHEELACTSFAMNFAMYSSIVSNSLAVLFFSFSKLDSTFLTSLLAVEDLDLNGVDSLKGVGYIAIGKHLCGPATDMTLRCCIRQHSEENGAFESQASYLRGVAIATCCHHLCQWKSYISKKYVSDMGFTKDDFHAITWFTSWAVDADHGSDFPVIDFSTQLEIMTEKKEFLLDSESCKVEDIVKNMQAIDRAVLGYMCKDIIDAARLMWVKEQGLKCELVKYVPITISPENRVLMAK
ncbi:hypothetical protein SASPL_105008 [Salvia splendens]|uniref:tRNA:m(4)X modification enzyme TRM13 n=1 Tax=Salvia splendens TaxID=180675 RepID=A0A8X8YI88_SALSN|nr:hypothetical protein SASPL_105008 [Salvia splendens]